MEDNDTTVRDDMLRQMRTSGVRNADICSALRISESELNRQLKRLGLIKVQQKKAAPACPPRPQRLPPGAVTLPPLPSLMMTDTTTC